MLSTTFKKFVQLESAGGILLFCAALVAILLVNTGCEDWYQRLQSFKFAIGPLNLTLLHWVNDGLMAVFFLIVGMEIKREILEGELSKKEDLCLPLFGAIGGMLVPALVFIYFSAADVTAARGWAIPAATDIAFAIGVLSLFGKRVPVSLKVFLTALAILDDLGAIIVIALFYTSDLNVNALLGSLLVLICLFSMGKLGVRKLGPFLLLGIILWFLVFKSGIHATIAGVALALTIPHKAALPKNENPLDSLMHALHPWTTFLILPIFSFLNAGVSLKGFGVSTLLAPIPLGIMLGLFVGKQVGVFIFSWLTIKLGWGRQPSSSTWAQLYAVSVATGIGFTMSLFIGGLAYGDPARDALVRIGVLIGSLLSALVAGVLLQLTLPKQP